MTAILGGAVRDLPQEGATNVKLQHCTRNSTSPLRSTTITMFLRRAAPALAKRAVFRPAVTRSFALSARQRTLANGIPEKGRPRTRKQITNKLQEASVTLILASQLGS